MSSTLLEVTRAGHEEIERLERLIVKDLQNEPASSKDRLFQSHRVRNMIDTITATTEKLVIFSHFPKPSFCGESIRNFCPVVLLGVFSSRELIY